MKQMKQIIIILIAILVAIPTISQAQELSKKEQKALDKQLKKEQQAEETSRKAAIVGLMMEYRRFVLEADQLRDKHGQTVNVSSMINFIASDSIIGVIQIGSNNYVGMNGVGGITVEGRIANYESIYNEKNGTYSVTYNINSPLGAFTVRMTAFPGGRADATVSSNWPGKVSYSGYLVPPAASKVYKGSSL
jgi:hypothetical protein